MRRCVVLVVDETTATYRHGQAGKRETFDGKLLLDKFRTYSFGTAPLKELHLSRMVRRMGGGYYESEHTVAV